MALLELLFGASRRASSSGLDANGWPAAGRTSRAGVPVNDKTALQYAPLWAALRAVNETLAMLPLVYYLRTEAGRERATTERLYALLDTAPNPDMTSMSFREGRYYHADWWGNAFAEIERDLRGEAVALWPIHPSRVRAPGARDTFADGRLVQGGYLVRSDDNQEYHLPAANILHIPGVLSEDGVWGKGVRDYANDAVGFGLAVDRHGASYFRSGGQPKAVLRLPGMRDAQTRQRFREEWREVHNSENGADVVILPVEGQYDGITHTAEQAQYLGTRGYNVRDIARFLRVPVYLLEEYEKAASFASVEMRGLEFVTYSLLPRARRVEQQIGLKLVPQDRRADYYAEHLFASLLRGDFEARMRGYQTALLNGLMTLNECRRLENLPAIGPAGDEHYVPLNMTTAARMALGEPAPGDQVRAEARVAQSLDAVRSELRAGAVSATVPGALLGAVASAVHADAVRRWLVRLSAAAEKERTGSDFPGWLADYAERQRPGLAQEMVAAGTALIASGRAALAPDLADRLLVRTTTELIAAYDQDTPAQFVARLKAWPGEAADLSRILLEEYS